MRRRSMLLVTIAFLVGGSLFAAPGAQAAGSPPAAPRLVGTAQARMTLIGFDAAQAKKVGNRVTTESGSQVLRDSKGAEIARVPLGGGTSPGALSPLNTVYGNCGSSFFYLYDLTGASFAMRTGFNLTSSAYDFAWHTRTIGANSFQTDNWEWSDFGPMWPGRSWSSGYQKSSQDTYAGTYYYGRVTSGTAYLVNGGICFSGYPNDGKYLYK